MQVITPTKNIQHENPIIDINLKAPILLGKENGRSTNIL